MLDYVGIFKDVIAWAREEIEGNIENNINGVFSELNELEEEPYEDEDIIKYQIEELEKGDAGYYIRDILKSIEEVKELLDIADALISSPHLKKWK